MSIRVRFAPSPTGYLHVGGLRTALYNYLFAKKNNGKLILRIEDTDRSRLVENAQQNLIDALLWAGIDFDESPVKQGEYGPYVQSERLEIYKKHVNTLIDKGYAYYAFDSSEELTSMRQRLQDLGKDPKYDRMSMKNQLTMAEDEWKQLLSLNSPYVIRLLVPDEPVVFKDIIRGEISVNGREIDDQILLKSDGFPTYHLANVVDDHLMQITHVIRGEEWLPSTPKHILLYKFFDWDIPEFAHLPLLLNKDKSKLSKRQGDVAVEDYRAKGYIRDAFINFIALLGWNPSGEQEIYTIDELIEQFNLEKVNKSGAVFDLVKLDWMNSYYLHHIVPIAELVSEMRELMGNSEDFSDEYIERVISLYRERISSVKELPEIADYMFAEPIVYDDDYKQKHWADDSEILIRELVTELDKVDDFTHKNLYEFVKNWIESKDMKLKVIIHPIRLILTGKSSGAGMFEIMEVLGKENCIRRFENYLNTQL